MDVRLKLMDRIWEAEKSYWTGYEWRSNVYGWLSYEMVGYVTRCVPWLVELLLSGFESLMQIRAHMDPHQIERWDPDPHLSDKIDPDP